MSDYSLFRLEPIHVRGKGEVAPKGYISPALQEMMDAAQRGVGTGLPVQTSHGEGDTPTTSPDPWSKEAWGDLR